MKHLQRISRPLPAQERDPFNEVFFFRLIVAIAALLKPRAPF